MGAPKEVEFNLKVMINKEKTKVLFAEIDSNFADVLLSFLALPLGTIVRILKKHYGDEAPAIGSLTTLYNALEDLDNDHFVREVRKQMLLNPLISFGSQCSKLKLDISDNQSRKYFSCESSSCSYPRRSNISLNCTTAKCQCGKMMNREIGVQESPAANDARGVFTVNTASFLIYDDLRMMSNVALPTNQTLRNLGITDTHGSEIRNVTFGFNEIMNLLKGSLFSPTPLSEIIIKKRPVESATARFEPGILLHESDKEAISNSKGMILKIMVQCSSNKLLFAQSEEDFIDFLFSLLAIPLGGVENLLGGNTCLEGIDNLYKSMRDLIEDKHWTTPVAQYMLMKPRVPSGYVSKNQILPLSGQIALFYLSSYDGLEERLSYSGGDSSFIRDLVGQGKFVEGPKTFMVTDDLTMTPWSLISSLSVLDELKIPISDVKVVEVHIGLQEALSILKASLTSQTALTDGLKINTMIMKQPKQEN